MEVEELLKKDKVLREASKILRVKEEDLPRVIDRFLREIEEMKKKLDFL